MATHSSFFFTVLCSGLLLSAPSRSRHLQGLPRSLPLAFEINQGQADSQVRFLARAEGSVFFLTDNAVVACLLQGSERTLMRMKFAAVSGVRPIRLIIADAPLTLVTPRGRSKTARR